MKPNPTKLEKKEAIKQHNAHIELWDYSGNFDSTGTFLVFKIKLPKFLTRCFKKSQYFYNF